MARLKTYLTTFVWQAGLGYLALWAVTYWTLDRGAIVFAQSGVCHADAAKVLFYWVCDGASSYAFLAVFANFALTVTVWSPVYIAAATVDPDAMAIAVPIVLAHVVGLPSAIFALVRLLAAAFDLVRAILGRARQAKAVDIGVVRLRPSCNVHTRRRILGHVDCRPEIQDGLKDMEFSGRCGAARRCGRCRSAGNSRSASHQTR